MLLSVRMLFSTELFKVLALRGWGTEFPRLCCAENGLGVGKPGTLLGVETRLWSDLAQLIGDF
jgi:hypothetical protein